MKHFLLATALLLGVQAFSQKEKKSKEDEKTFYKDANFETDDYRIYITDGVAVGAYVKFKMKVFNKTNDYLVIKTSEMVYLADSKTVTNKEKNFVVAPNEEDWKVLDFKGTEMQADKFALHAKGIYKASAGGKISEAANFDLPPSKNEFTAGNVSCSLKKHEASTSKVVAKFECTYAGDGVAVVNPYKCAAIMPNNTENANSKKNKPMVLENGKTDDFTVVFDEVVGAGDLQKSAIKIKWNETFRESKLMPLEAPKVDVEKDLEKKDPKKK